MKLIATNVAALVKECETILRSAQVNGVVVHRWEVTQDEFDGLNEEGYLITDKGDGAAALFREVAVVVRP